MINEKLLGKLTTNYIVECGTNDNGSYIKFKDGTLHQWGRTPMNDELKTKHADTGFYRNASEKFHSFPIPFVGVAPTVNVTAQAALNIAYVSTNELSRFGYYALVGTSTNANYRWVHWRATGKWK
jgi:hypothetical protein|nr:MAG TPA: putative tail fiber protein [Caudoviricetes sp.]